MKRRVFLGATAAMPLVFAGGAWTSRARSVRWLDLLDERQRRHGQLCAMTGEENSQEAGA